MNNKIFNVELLQSYNKIATSTNSEIKLMSKCGLHIFTGYILANITKETITISSGFSKCKITLHDDKCVFKFNNINGPDGSVYELEAISLHMYVNDVLVPSIIIDNIKYVFNEYEEAKSAGSVINKATRPSFMNRKKSSDNTKNEKSKPTKIDALLLDKIKKDIAISIIKLNKNNVKWLTYDPIEESFITPDKFYKLTYSLEDMDQDKITTYIYDYSSYDNTNIFKCMITYVDDKIHVSPISKNDKYKEFINLSDDGTLINEDDDFYNLLSYHIFGRIEYYKILMAWENLYDESFSINIFYDANRIEINENHEICYTDDFVPIINIKDVIPSEKCIMTDDIDDCIKFIQDNHICGKDLLNKPVKFDIGDTTRYSPYIRSSCKMVIEIDDHDIICLKDGMFTYYHTIKTKNKYGSIDKTIYASCNINDVLNYIKNPNQYRLTMSNVPSNKNDVIFNYEIKCIMTSTPECTCVANGVIKGAYDNAQTITTFKINRTTSLEEPVYELTFDESDYTISSNYIFELLQKIFKIPPEILHYTSKELLADKNKIIAAQNLMIYEGYKFTHVEITEQGKYIIWTLMKDDETYYIYEDLPLRKAYRLKKHYMDKYAHYTNIEMASDTLMMSSNIVDILEFIKSGLLFDPIKHVPHDDNIKISLDLLGLYSYKGCIDYNKNNYITSSFDFIIDECDNTYTLIILYGENILFIHSGYETLFHVFKVLFDFDMDILIKTLTKILSYNKNENVDSYFVQVFKTDPNNVYEVAVKYKNESNNHTFIKKLFNSHDDVIKYLKTLNV